MVGFTPSLSTAVWVGTTQGDKPLQNKWGGAVYGSGLPSDIWKDTMDGALEDTENESFPKPTEIGGYAGPPAAPPPPPPSPPPPTETTIQPSIEVAPGITIPFGPPTVVPIGPPGAARARSERARRTRGTGSARRARSRSATSSTAPVTDGGDSEIEDGATGESLRSTVSPQRWPATREAPTIAICPAAPTFWAARSPR